MLVLLLLSASLNVRYKIRLFVNEFLTALTITHLYKIAFWNEREIWDMFGILFQNHGDLRRILTDYGFNGHPLRKDFPLSGFSELLYDDFIQRIGSAPVSLAQEFRYFLTVKTWEILH